MGFGFRKRIKIAPGVSINIGKKGVSGVSVGKKGATVSVSSKGARATASLPGTGLSYSTKLGGGSKSPAKSAGRGSSAELDADTYQLGAQQPESAQRKVGLLLGLGIMLFPYIFSWFLLRDGHSNVSRTISFLWMALVIYTTFGRISG
jgi:hypothetical protein